MNGCLSSPGHFNTSLLVERVCFSLRAIIVSNDLKTTTTKSLTSLEIRITTFQLFLGQYVLLLIEIDKGSHHKQWGRGRAGPTGINAGELAPVARRGRTGGTITPEWNNSRIAERCLSEGPVLMLYQKPETLNQTNGLFAMHICKQSCFGKRVSYG